MFNQLIQLAILKPRIAYAIVALLTLIAVAFIPQIKIDTDPENMLGADNPARVFHNQIKQEFTMPEMIVLGMINEVEGIYNPSSLANLQAIVNQILLLDGVIEQDTLALNLVDNITQGERAGEIRFSWMMAKAPQTMAQSHEIQQAVSRLPLLFNTLVSGDGKATAVYVPIESKDLSYQIAEQIRGITAKYAGQDQFYITGLPVAEDQFGFEMFMQMGVAAPLAGLAIFLLLLVFFRSLVLVTAPMLMAMATVLIIMGALIGAGFTVHIMSSMIAIFLMPIAVVDSVHILSEFADRYKAGDDPKEVVTKVMSHLLKPMLFTSITSAVGFMSLLLTPIPPVQVFGLFVGLGIFLAFLLTITFIPAYLATLSEPTLEKLQSAFAKVNDADVSKDKLSRILSQFGGFADKRSKVVIVSALVLMALSVEGISRIEINDNPVNWFKADHQIRIADKKLNQHFAGTYDAWLVFEQAAEESASDVAYFKARASELAGLKTEREVSSIQTPFFTQSLAVLIDDLLFDAEGDEALLLEELATVIERQLAKRKAFTDPKVLTYLAKMQEDLVQTGLVGKVNSLADIVRTVNRELQGGSAQDFNLPATANGVSQTLLQYQSSHRPDDLWHFVSQDYQKSLLWLQLTSGDNQHMSQVIKWVDAYVANNPLPAGLDYQWAGKAYINVVWQDAMVSGMLKSLMSSFVVVFVMMVVLFRSFAYGVLAMLPLSFTLAFIYGVIGWTGKAYDMPIAVLSALTLGLSIDFAIHFIQRFRELKREKGDLQLALSEMFSEPARAISRNAIVIAVGFTPLLLSPLVPYITVGFFLAMIMSVSALVTLLLLPAIMTFFKTNSGSKA